MRLTLVLLLLAAIPAALAATHLHAALAAPRPHPARTPHRAAPPSATAPKSIGVWDRWQAATHEEGGQLVCYAFTRAAGVTALPGRGDVVLTVTERPGIRDAVAISAGYAYSKDAIVDVQVGANKVPFYAAGRSAFARDGRAAVADFQRGREVLVKF